MRNNLVEEIKSRITIKDILSYYGYNEGRRMRTACPLHHGKNNNFCYTDSVYHCWVCGAKGDAITLVMELFGIQYRQALIKINTDFNLGLTSKKPTYRERLLMREDKKLEISIKQYKAHKQALYRGVAIFYRELFKRSVNSNLSSHEVDTMNELELYLNENIEEVIVPWI